MAASPRTPTSCATTRPATQPWPARAADLLREAGLTATVDPTRGLDHGVFIPMKVAFPDADIPVVEMSVDRDLDPGTPRRRRPRARPAYATKAS